jgi:hypothetical protein
MPLVTTRASVAYGAGFGKVLGSGVAPDLGAMFPIGMAQVGSAGVAYVDFTSIPSTYTHLQIRILAKSQRANAYGSTIWIYFNGDYAPTIPSSYNFHFMGADGSSTSAAYYSNNTATTYGIVGGGAMGTTATNVASASIIDIHDYKNTSKYKTVRTLWGEDNNSLGNISIYSGLWQNTAAVTSIRVYADNYTFAQFSSIALYGIKGE